LIFFNAQSFSSGFGNLSGELDCRDALVPWNAYRPVQFTATSFSAIFSAGYKSLVVDGSGTGYLSEYVPLNPMRANLLTPDQKLSAYKWNSYGGYLKKPGHRMEWLRADRYQDRKGGRSLDPGF
jgi:hypothetical protein